MRKSLVGGVGIAVATLWLMGSLAHAEDDEDPITGGQTGGSNDGGTLTAVAVSLTGNGLAGGGSAGGGSAGGSAGGTTVTVRVPTPCYWSPGYDGQSFYDSYYENGRAHSFGVLGLKLPSDEEIAAHRDEDGTWYFVGMSSDDQFSDEETNRCDRRMQADNGSGYLWVPAGESPPQPPPPPIPAEQLAQIAMENLAAPQPVVERNPTTTSFVNLSTWFWVVDGASTADGFVPLTVTATAGANSATVTADPNRLNLRSTGGPTAACAPDQARTAWASGVDEAGACTITHRRSSAAQPGLAYTVTATSAYVASWTGQEGGAPVAGGSLGPVVSPSASVDLPVGEIQALVVR